MIANIKNISEWKSKELSDESMKPPDNSLSPLTDYLGDKIRLKFNGRQGEWEVFKTT